MAVADRILVRSGEGGSVDLGGLGVDFKIWGEDTGGSFSLVEHPIEPGRLVPPHLHRAEDEFSYILEGEVGARIGDRELQAGPGCYVFKPRNVPHTFWNAGPEPARLIEIISPAGFERFFERLGELARTVEPSEFAERRAALAVDYDLEFVMDWAPELKLKYDLRLLGE